MRSDATEQLDWCFQRRWDDDARAKSNLHFNFLSY